MADGLQLYTRGLLSAGAEKTALTLIFAPGNRVMTIKDTQGYNPQFDGVGLPQYTGGLFAVASRLRDETDGISSIWRGGLPQMVGVIPHHTVDFLIRVRERAAAVLLDVSSLTLAIHPYAL